MMGRLEKRYCWIMDILAWGHGKYTEEQLEFTAKFIISILKKFKVSIYD